MPSVSKIDGTEGKDRRRGRGREAGITVSVMGMLNVYRIKIDSRMW